MKKNKKLLFISSLFGIATISAIPIFSCVLSKNNSSVLTSSNHEETVTEETNPDQTNPDQTKPEQEMDKNFPTSPLEPVNDRENGIIYQSYTFRGVKGYKISSANMTKTSYKLKEIPNPNFPNLPLICIDNAFNGNTVLAKMPDIPKTVMSMMNAFTGCSSMATFSNIPNICTNINSAFSGCSALNSETPIVIPRSIENAYWAFKNCSALTCDIEFQFALTDTNRKDNVSMMFKGCNNVQKVIFTDPYTSQNLTLPEIGFTSVPTKEDKFNTEYTLIERTQLPSLYDSRYVSDIYDPKNVAEGTTRLKKFFVANSIVTKLPSQPIGGVAITAPTEIIFKDVNASLKAGTISFQYEIKNYFENNIYHTDTKLIDKTIVLDGFKKVSGETTLDQIPGISLANVLPSDVNASNWNHYFNVNNVPVGATITFRSINAVDYIPPAVAGSVPSSKLTLEIDVSQYFVQKGDDFELVREPKTLIMNNTDMKFTEPTHCTIRNVESGLSVYPNQYTPQQIKDSLQFTNLPDGASVKVFVANKDTMDADGFISVKAWVSQYYNNEGKLVINTHYHEVNEYDQSTWTDPFIEGNITGFLTIKGQTTINVKEEAFKGNYPQFLGTKLTKDTASNFFSFSNLPADGALTGVQVSSWVNMTGTAQINLTFSKFSKVIDSKLQILENHVETITVSNMKRLTGVTKIILDEKGINKRMYPSQVSPTFVEDNKIVKIMNPAPEELGSSRLQINTPTPSDPNGQITFGVTCTNLLVNSEDKKDVIFVNTNMVQTFSIGGFFQSSGPTTIVPVDVSNQDIPDTIEPEEFTKYFYIENLPIRDAQSGLESKQYEVNQISPNVNNKTVQATVTLYQYFNDQGKYVDVSNGGQPKIVTLTNVSFNRDTILENNWANGTNWLWLIVGVAGFILLLLAIIIIILAIFKGKRDRQDYNLKKMVVNNKFSSNALPSSKPLLGPSTIAPSQTVLTYSKPNPGNALPKQQAKVPPSPNKQPGKTIPTRTAPPGGVGPKPVKK